MYPNLTAIRSVAILRGQHFVGGSNQLLFCKGLQSVVQKLVMKSFSLDKIDGILEQ